MQGIGKGRAPPRTVKDTRFGRKYAVVGELKGLRQTRDCFAEVAMKFGPLDTVVLNHDIPEHGLRAGDLGAVVEVYADDGLEVEFVKPSGDTRALVTLESTDVRPVAKTDVLSVRAS